MAYLYDVPNATEGIDNILVTTQASVHIFIPMVLFFIWGVIFMSGVLGQKKRSSYVDTPMWSTLASITILMVALPMTLIAGLIQLEWLVVIVIITIISGLWLFLDKNRSEV